VSRDLSSTVQVVHGTDSADARPLELLPLDDPRWGSFVAGHRDATPFHDPAWAGLLARTYRLSGEVLAQVGADGTVDAGIPVLVPARLPGQARRLVSLPFTDVIDPLVPPEGGARFATQLDRARERLGVTRIELRGHLDGAQAVDPRAVVHGLELTEGIDAVGDGFSKSTRRNIRLAERRGVVVRRAREERDLTEIFFALHLATRSRLGVPVQPRRFFRLLWRVLTDAGLGFVLVAEQEGLPVASAVFLRNATTLVYKYSASDSSALSSKPNDLLIATAIREACESGCSHFDFGRSDLAGEGLRAFKSGFGAAEEALRYSVVGDGTAGVPGGGDGVVQRVLRRSPTLATRVVGELFYRYAA